MSWANWSCVTLSGASSAEWQSRQVFGDWATAGLVRSAVASNARPVTITNLFRNESIHAHRNDIRKSKDAGTHDPSLTTASPKRIKEWKQNPDQAGKAEDKNSEDLAID